jgi:ATP-dependent helicase/nuclease subunit A
MQPKAAKKRGTILSKLLRFPSTTSDAEARAAALDTRASCIVEAPAGSGKTGLLVQRYLKLLGTEAVDQPEEVLAITFTNKATAELRERVLEQLQRAKQGVLAEDPSNFEQETWELAKTALDRSGRLGWGLLERPSRLNIRSIDSVCAEIANSLPLLSGAGGPRQPVEDAEPLYRLAARRTLLQLGGNDLALHAALCTVLLHRDGNLADGETLLADMLRAREQWGELMPLAPNDANDASLDREVRLKLERSLESIVCAGLSFALRAMPADVLQELTSLAARLGIEPGLEENPSPIALCAGKDDPPGAVANHLDHWVALIWLILKTDGEWRKRHSRLDMKFEIPKSDAARLKDLVQTIQSDELRDALAGVLTLPPSKYPDAQWEVAKAIFRVLRHSLAELRLLFAERGECDFTEIALSAREALNSDDSSSELALSAGGTLRHMLVDEMQDTSSGQYELLDLLTRSWDGRTQTLFLVGDPKQSIYLFRQARVERFLRTMQDKMLGEIELEPLQLTSNFRSQAKLVANFNEIFDALFPRPDDRQLLVSEGINVPFVKATAVREETNDAGVVWHPALLAKSDSRNDHVAEEARNIRCIIEERLAMPLPQGRDEPQQLKPWRIAVLGRAKNHLKAVIEEFKKDYGNGPLRYRAIDLDPLDQLPEVLDALALTQALLHPSDRIAWLAVLHAPWCGLGLADLLALTSEGEEADPIATVARLVQERRAFVSQQGQRLIDRAWPLLATAVATLGRTSLATHVDRTWRSLGGDVALSAERRKNVQRYLDVLREVETKADRVDLGLLKRRLNKLYAEPASASPVDGKLPVELLTIHKAKGLEWDLVLVPGLERGSGQLRSVLLNWLEFDGASNGDVPSSVVLAPIGQKGTQKDRLSSWLTDIRAQREAAEDKRVFYVASTRAREELHLFGAATLSTKGELAQPRYDSLLRASWPAAAQHFERELAEAIPAAEELLMDALNEESEQDFSLAAAEDTVEAEHRESAITTIQRLPLSFDPSARFREANEQRLLYPAASALRHTVTFDRPEGSFAVRAFGNVVHRYLQVLAARLESGATSDDLLAELPSWQSRLAASLRGEGLPPSLVGRESARAQGALVSTLGNPVGRWILSPQASAASEHALTVAALGARGLRVDRTFLAGAEPLRTGKSHIWIIDFKTTQQGSRSDEDFTTDEIAKYKAQLEAYAALRRTLPDGDLPIQLGLFYPLLPRLLHWSSEGPVDRTVY